MDPLAQGDKSYSCFGVIEKIKHFNRRDRGGVIAEIAEGPERGRQVLGLRFVTPQDGKLTNLAYGRIEPL
jgi:hypothetical protein